MAPKADVMKLQLSSPSVSGDLCKCIECDVDNCFRKVATSIRDRVFKFHSIIDLLPTLCRR